MRKGPLIMRKYALLCAIIQKVEEEAKEIPLEFKNSTRKGSKEAENVLRIFRKKYPQIYKKAYYFFRVSRPEEIFAQPENAVECTYPFNFNPLTFYFLVFLTKTKNEMLWVADTGDTILDKLEKDWPELAKYLDEMPGTEILYPINWDHVYKQSDAHR